MAEVVARQGRWEGPELGWMPSLLALMDLFLGYWFLCSYTLGDC